jgi:peptidoglycan/LPS O-acetylase OafA/YrhL
VTFAPDLPPSTSSRPAPAEAPGPALSAKGEGRLFVLDGWRAISILLVLATHLLPLGPKSWRLNLAAGEMGMAIFFTLSGFLITQQLHARHNVAAFFVRRIFRIVPLAWLYTIVALTLLGASLRGWLSHLLFIVNYDFGYLTDYTTHFWSLCVEVQFYCGIGLLMAVTRFRGFKLLPVAWLVFLIVRAVHDPGGAIQTHLIVDEILSGTCLALVSLGTFGPRVKTFISRLPFPLLAVALLACSHAAFPKLGLFRGFVASCLVGHTLFTAGERRYRWLGHRALRYIAETSYAMYVIHPLTHYGWLGTGSVAVKYAKRLITFGLTFGLSYLSTFKFEKPFLELGKKLAKRIERRTGPLGTSASFPTVEPR